MNPQATALVHVVPSTGLRLPSLIAGAGDRAALRFLEFFTVNIRTATRGRLMRGPRERAPLAREAARRPGVGLRLIGMRLHCGTRKGGRARTRLGSG